MNVLIYCQHVVGIGHLCRIVEIIRALKQHEVTLLLGGPPIDISLPKNVSVIQLPGLMMDAEYTRMFPVHPKKTLDETKQERRKILLGLAKNFIHDVLLVELYPFGRGGFHFELQPFLQAIRQNSKHACPIACSLRDILVEKKNQQDFEQRALDRINSFFDCLLVHSDPEIITLDSTFSRVADIKIPVIYTGYICREPDTENRNKQYIKSILIPNHTEKLITVSAGGGSFGYALLEAAINAYATLQPSSLKMHVFTGPYLDEEYFSKLKKIAGPGVFIERFTDNFPAWLAAADLSISMGGYNTSMNVVAAGKPSLILPYNHDREQGFRAERLAQRANIKILSPEDLEPSRFAAIISQQIRQPPKTTNIRLDGAQKTAAHLIELSEQGYNHNRVLDNTVSTVL